MDGIQKQQSRIQNCYSICQFLLNNGAYVNDNNYSSKYCIPLLAAHCHEDFIGIGSASLKIIRLLLKHSADFDSIRYHVLGFSGPCAEYSVDYLHALEKEFWEKHFGRNVNIAAEYQAVQRDKIRLTFLTRAYYPYSPDFFTQENGKQVSSMPEPSIATTNVSTNKTEESKYSSGKLLSSLSLLKEQKSSTQNDNNIETQKKYMLQNG